MKSSIEEKMHQSQLIEEGSPEFVRKIERYEENDWLNNAIEAIMALTESDSDELVPTAEAVTASIKMLTGLAIDFVPVPEIYSNEAKGLVFEWGVDGRELEIEVLAGETWETEWLKTVLDENNVPVMSEYIEGSFSPGDSLQAKPLVEWVMGK